YLAAARGAFAYEDTLFDADRGNWPDLRSADTPGTPERPPTFPSAWCHGAGGIALARLRAVTLDPAHREGHLAYAHAALAATQAAAMQALSYPRADASLCHGLAGLSEILWIGGHSLDNEVYRVASTSIVSSLIARHADSGDWPSGVAS